MTPVKPPLGLELGHVLVGSRRDVRGALAFRCRRHRLFGFASGILGAIGGHLRQDDAGRVVQEEHTGVFRDACTQERCVIEVPAVAEGHGGAAAQDFLNRRLEKRHFSLQKLVYRRRPLRGVRVCVGCLQGAQLRPWVDVRSSRLEKMRRGQNGLAVSYFTLQAVSLIGNIT